MPLTLSFLEERSASGTTVRGQMKEGEKEYGGTASHGSARNGQAQAHAAKSTDQVNVRDRAPAAAERASPQARKSWAGPPPVRAVPRTRKTCDVGKTESTGTLQVMHAIERSPSQ